MHHSLSASQTPEFPPLTRLPRRCESAPLDEDSYHYQIPSTPASLATEIEVGMRSSCPNCNTAGRVMSSIDSSSKTVETAGIERQIVDLQEKMEYMTALMQNHMELNETDVERANSELMSRNEELEETLRISEGRLFELQEELNQIHEEYQSDAEEMNRQVEELTELLEEEQLKKNELKRNLESTLKSKQSLETYLKTLPSEEEFKKLQRSLRTKEDELERINQRLSAVLVEKEKLVAKDQDGERAIVDIERENEELKLRVIDLEDKMARRYHARTMTEETKEKILMERDELKDENRRIAKYVVITQRRLKEEGENYKLEIADKAAKLNELNEELEELSDRLEEEKSTNRFLREDLTESKVKVLTLERKIENLTEELDEAVKSDELTQDMEKYYAMLSKEVLHCVRDLQSMSAVMTQLTEGNDPNISMLLGIKTLENTEGASANKDGLSKLERLEILKKEANNIKDVRRDIHRIRDELSEKYADSIGENMNSCITQ